ncbi:unnamed protein product [Cyprideis torosa]|uniref:Uncharacterized protein n=1 Tax=Cyprideis torosa TaxID=163714 RepID=A0A7R8WLI5_9CRUS|nr:unnamed protein product [Cyprideis torosa]CAG0898216.1 unnamed protein product [Cyprideis torosa]
MTKKNMNARIAGALLELLEVFGTDDDESEVNLDQELRQLISSNSKTGNLDYYIMPKSDEYHLLPNQDPANTITKEKVELGLAQSPAKPMGFETYSCSSCHVPSKGFLPGRLQGIADGGVGFGVAGIRLNIAIDDDGKSFIVLKIKVREKIVADGLDDDSFDVTKKGIHLSADKFNELTEDEKTIVIDMRNHYESEVGKFKMAITPDVETFREALPVVEKMLEDKKDHNIVMYCTGGIRCEKASAYYKHKGFKNVYQLDGGIIEYARQAEALGIENKFIGKNFVFDERLGERISEDVISKCHQCGKPCDDHTNCANEACHILFIQCEDCAKEYNKTCSVKCKEYYALSEEKKEELKGQIEFNGTKFGKGVNDN